MKPHSFYLLISAILMVTIISNSCKKTNIKLYGDISGKVKHAITGEPISGAAVTLSPNSSSTTTGTEGAYSFAELEPKEYSIQVMKDGFQTNTTSVTVVAGENRVGDILITPAQPVLNVSTTLLDFGSDKSMLPFEIRNEGAAELTWNIAVDKPWMTANPTTGITTAEIKTVNITIDRGLLGRTTYNGTIVVSSNGGSATINVIVNVTGPLMKITPTELDFGTTDTDKILQISNIGIGTLTYNSIASHTWMSLDNPNGSTTTDIKIMHVFINRTGMTPGDYSGTIVVNSNANNITIPVTMKVIAPTTPTVVIGTAVNLTDNSAQVSGNITSLGSSVVTQHGHCWNTTTTPTIENSKTTLGNLSIIGNFDSNITELSPATTYYVRAYATNSVGTAYSSQIQFTTDAGQKPTVTTSSVSNITSITAKSGGNVTVQGGTSVTTRGVCWNTNPNPTITNSHTSDGIGTGTFISNITNLSPATIYYVRAFATNAAGTSYGSQMQFTTEAGDPPIVTTATVSDIYATTAIGGGNVTLQGGTAVTARGVCWSTSQNPVITNSHTTNGGGTGSYISNLTGLTPSTTYYVRAYATNIAGTVYGNQVQFTTDVIVLPSVTTNIVSNITETTATGGGNVSNQGDSPVITRGVCWSTNPSPTISNSHTIDGSGLGSFNSNLTELLPSTLYYVRAFATNSSGTSYGNQISFTTSQLTLYIGQNYGGGIIFYIDETNQHGLISAATNLEDTNWGCSQGSIEGTSTDLGTGAANTLKIVKGCGETGFAARICNDLVLNGYSDWYLPSLDELYLVYENLFLHGFGDIEAGSYWSSSQTNWPDMAYSYYFTSGFSHSSLDQKYFTNHVRAIRSF